MIPIGATQYAKVNFVSGSQTTFKRNSLLYKGGLWSWIVKDDNGVDYSCRSVASFVVPVCNFLFSQDLVRVLIYEFLEVC
jgi:hypothetical protein